MRSFGQANRPKVCDNIFLSESFRGGYSLTGASRSIVRFPMPGLQLGGLPPRHARRYSRRKLIENGLGTISAMALANGGLPRLAAAREAVSSSSKPDGYIDAHVHVWTPDTGSYPLTEGFRREDMQPASFTPEQLFAHCKPSGVTRIVLIQMSFYGVDNSYMLDTIREHREAFVGVAVIDDEADRPDKDMRRLKPLGVRGFRLVTHERDAEAWFATSGIRSMWKCGAEENLAMCMLCNADVVPAIDRMCERYPETPVVIDHMARIGVDGTLRDTDIDQLCRLARHRKTYVKTSAFYGLGKKTTPYLDMAPMIQRLLDTFGPQRLMWASDCPFQVNPGHNYQDSVDLIAKRLDFLSPSDREWLLRKTADKFYFS